MRDDDPSLGGLCPCLKGYDCNRLPGWPCPKPRPHLQLHVRTTWSEYHGRPNVFYSLTGISLTRPTLRTTWDTDLASVYYTAKRVAKGLWVQETYDGSYRLTGQVTLEPLY